MSPYQKTVKPSVLVDICNLGTWKAGAGGLRIRGHIGLHSVFLASLGYTAEVV